jgi:hypothetical protein
VAAPIQSQDPQPGDSGPNAAVGLLDLVLEVGAMVAPAPGDPPDERIGRREEPVPGVRGAPVGFAPARAIVEIGLDRREQAIGLEIIERVGRPAFPVSGRTVRLGTPLFRTHELREMGLHWMSLMYIAS